MKFFDLKNKQEFIPIVATWFHEEWSYLNPTRTYKDLLEYIDKVINDEYDDKIFIGINGETPVSSVSLRKEEVKTSKGCTPWLSSLVVDKKHRKSGVGSETISLFENYCSNNNIKTIYLFTETEELESWYKKQGWLFQEKASLKSHEGSVMIKSKL